MMAQEGLKAMVTLNGEKILDDVICAYDECIEYGHNNKLGEDMIWGAGIYLADSREEAIKRLEPAHDQRSNGSRRSVRAHAHEQGRSWGTPGAPSARLVERRRGAETWFCGPRAGDRGHQVDQGKIPGLENFMIHWAEGIGPKEFKEQLAGSRRT